MNKAIKSIPETEGALRASVVNGMDGKNQISEPETVSPPNPEVTQVAKRRRFSFQYKTKVIREADTCTKSGDISALLRREGLYSSHLSVWRHQRAASELQSLAPKTKGRRPIQKNPLASENTRRKTENKRLKLRRKKAEIIIDVQKKVSEMLSLPLDSLEGKGNE